MARKYAWLLVLLTAAVPAFAGASNGSISGYVKSSSGTPQMGAIVEVFGASGAPIATAYTDARGHYQAPVAAGVYYVKVTAPSFLPALRDGVDLRTGATMVLNFTLNTLFEAFQIGGVRKAGAEDEEDWKWTLRSMSNRPVLRVVEGSPVIVTRAEDPDNGVLAARVAFIAGSDGAGSGSSGGNTLFKLEHSLFSRGVLSFSGNVGYNGDSAPATVLRAAYTHQFATGASPEFAFTMRRFRTAPITGDGAVMQSLAFSASDTYNFLNFADVTLGGEFQSIDFLGRASAFKPFANVDAHLSRNMVVSYRYATSQPTTRLEKGFDTSPADMTESGPRMSLVDWRPQIERARHHEVALARRKGANIMEVAAFSDSIRNPAMLGTGEIGPQPNLLPDLYSGTFAVTGRDFSASGLRVSAQRTLFPTLTASLAWAWSGTLELPEQTALADARSAMQQVRRHSLTARAAGTAPVTRTRWTASYKWSEGSPLLPLDMFNESATNADPYLNLFLRQPIPDFSFLPSGMEALVDVRNLLAEGYVPVLGNDGQTVYLVQSARAVRGGVAFKF